VAAVQAATASGQRVRRASSQASVQSAAMTTALCAGKTEPRITVVPSSSRVLLATSASSTSGTNAPTVPTRLTRSARQARLRQPSAHATTATTTINNEPRSTEIAPVANSAIPSVRRSAIHAATAPSTTDRPLCRTTQSISQASAIPIPNSSASPATRLINRVQPGPTLIDSRKNSTP
jgi:hypothetical protein